jgi:hypothetical protein
MPIERFNFYFRQRCLRSRRITSKAHLWDTGDAVSELNRVMKVRAKALFNLEKQH